eukprot:m.113091 g.113091  ORF g.113091 m.113091 type:complete len:288 (-) comp17060_c0_seq1:150-1013(-)
MDTRFKPPGVRWAHATNSQALLRNALSEDTSIHMIEADVMISNGGNVIMSHPPIRESDLTLHDFMVKISDHNAAASSASRHIGVKLDWKDPEAIDPGLHVVKTVILGEESSSGRMEERCDVATVCSWNGPLWLNADIVMGPGNKTPKHNADEFVSKCRQHFDGVAFSLGWTVAPFNAYSTASWKAHRYTDKHCADMLHVCERHRLTDCHVTFAMSAIPAQQSPDVVAKLLAANPNYTITLWGNTDAACRAWIRTLDAQRVYVDTKDVDGWNVVWCTLQLARLCGYLQ